MIRIFFATLLSAIIVLSTGQAEEAVKAPEKGEWIKLFNGKDLTGWKVNTGHSGDEESLEANEIFQVRDGVLRVYPGAENGSKQYNATLVHEKKWESYHLRVEYRWGENKFQPRMEAERDSGVLFHIHSEPEKVWPPSVELQLGDGKPGDVRVTGDLCLIGNSRGESPSEEKKYSPESPMQIRGQKDPGEKRREIRTKVVVHAEKPIGEWNTVDLIVHGSEKAEFHVNGQLVNEVYGLKFRDGTGDWKLLDSGFIGLEAEWAQVEFRNVSIKPLAR
ncbi:MAG: 3-keto-disaccharide hydrolase [Luteolibacter sp.]